MQVLPAYAVPGELPYRAINVGGGVDLDQVFELRQALRLCLYQHMHSLERVEHSDMAVSLLFAFDDGNHQRTYDMWFDRAERSSLVGCWTCVFDDEGMDALRLPWPVFGRRRRGYEALFPFTVAWGSVDEFERCALSQLLGGGTPRGWELQHIAMEMGVETAAYIWRKDPALRASLPHMISDVETDTD